MTASAESALVRTRIECTLALMVALVAALLTFPTPAFAAEPIRSVHYSYDAFGRQLSAKFDSPSGADGIANTYNIFGELLTSQATMGTFSKTLYSTYDDAGRRTQLKHPENTNSYTFSYCYDAAARLTGIGQGTSCTTTPLESFTYGNSGLVSNRAEGAGSSAAYGWDDAGRLVSLASAFTGTAPGVSWNLAYNPASQISSETRDNDAYAWGGAVAVNRNYAVNGLNQYTSAGPASFTHDANGNLTSDGTNTYAYDIENRLVTASSGSLTTTLTYDPLGRLFQVVRKWNSTTISDTRFLYDGDALVLEYNTSGTVANRYVHGSNAAADDPLVWYSGANLTNKKWLHANHQGSIVAMTDSAGGNPAINSYDEYGIPASSNTGRFQYTGQAWLSEIGMYHFKARIYSPTLGRFLQTDPIGYDDQINLYAYVGNDPLNFGDPTGTYSYLVLRSTHGFFHHAFIVVADKLGGSIQKQYSYSSAGAVYDDALVAVSGRHETAVKDAAAWSSLAKGPQKGVVAVLITAKDDTVIAVGNAVNSALGSDPMNEKMDYAPAPTSFTPSSACNSNCPPFAIADEALAIEGKGPMPVPKGTNPIGRNQSDHVRDLIKGRIEGDIVVGRRCFGRTDCTN